MHAFIDAFVVGEGEEVMMEIITAVESAKVHHEQRRDVLLRLARIPGVYVPRFYDVAYLEDGTVAGTTPNVPAFLASSSSACFHNFRRRPPAS